MAKNHERAKRAEAALRAYVQDKGEKWEPGCEAGSNLVDLLADLMHWCRWKHLADMASCFETAVMHFEAEAVETTRPKKSELLQAARGVLAKWERGDLAAAELVENSGDAYARIVRIEGQLDTLLKKITVAEALALPEG